jgi:hypothetical protein
MSSRQFEAGAAWKGAGILCNTLFGNLPQLEGLSAQVRSEWAITNWERCNNFRVCLVREGG